VTDSHTPGLSATSARNETARVVPRYYSATRIWASTTTTGTLLPNRVIERQREAWKAGGSVGAREAVSAAAGADEAANAVEH
jgi:hypothetical protein